MSAPAPTAEPTALGLLLTAASVAGAVLTLGGVLWWLLKPRVSAWLGKLASDSAAAARELDPDLDGSTADSVRVARELAEQIPGLAARLELVEQRTAPLEELSGNLHALDLRTEATERELIDHRRRLGNLEEAVITGRRLHDRTMERQ